MFKTSAINVFGGFSIFWALSFIISILLSDSIGSKDVEFFYLISSDFFSFFLNPETLSATMFIITVNSMIYGVVSTLLVGFVNYLIKRLERKKDRYRIFF